MKQSKEGRRFPGVMKLFQESENSAKPQFIHGHMFGHPGILAGNVRQWACILLSIRLHDNLKTVSCWNGAAISCASHIVQMVEDTYKAAETFGSSLLLLDWYFLSVSALKMLAALNEEGTVHMEIVTKGKRSCTTFEKLESKKPGRGRPPKKGSAFHLTDLFSLCSSQSQETDMELYGKKEKVRY